MVPSRVVGVVVGGQDVRMRQENMDGSESSCWRSSLGIGLEC